MIDNLKQIKFSNLLRNNEDYISDKIEMQTSFFQSTPTFLTRPKRRSLQPASNNNLSKRMNFSPQKQERDTRQIINTSKINRLLLETQFEKHSEKEKKKGKNHYIVRKKTEKHALGTGFMKKCQLSSRKRTHTDVIHSKGEERKASCKIRKKPIFGIEDIDVSIENCLKKKMGDVGVLLSQSSNIFNNTFYSTIKKKSDVPRITSPRQRIKWLRERCRKNQMEPEIITLLPRSFANEQALNRKKNINKMYTTNFGSFNFPRSKTEQIEINSLCGWQEEEIHGDDGLIQQTNFF